MPAQKIITNRVCILGLDSMYRFVMRQLESGVLLGYATEVAQRINLLPADVPLEGYYAETPELASYFRYVRAIQETPAARQTELDDLPAYHALLRVTASRLYGPSQRGDSLLPRAVDPLTRALNGNWPWTVRGLVDAAHSIVSTTNDISLVAIAALSRDPVTLAATRESVVLYAEKGLGRGATQEPEFVWRVDPDINERATAFAVEFNRLFNMTMPLPEPANAALFWAAYQANMIVGRCVNIGRMPASDARYHWAIHRQAEGELAVHEFWANEVWTTQRFSALLDRNGCMSKQPV